VTLWGQVLSIIAKVFMPFIDFPPTEVDVLLGDEGLSLSDFGIPGRVLYTPGHSSGSVSVLLDSGEAFVGDLAMNTFPLRLTPGLPIFAEDPAAVIASWELLLEAGAREVYPAHGKPFPADVIRRAIAV
jgi:glyoxylase-like metal-dependent hydrolase (beta-lactamase superfamily II)